MTSSEKSSGSYAGGWSESGFDSAIPVWDGRADSLREFRRTVVWWLSSIDIEKTRFFNLAARFAMKQKGSARLRALEFTPDELAFVPAVEVPDPDRDGETLVLSKADYTIGVWKIIDAWDSMVGRTLADKKGELRERFYLTMKRNPTESVVAFALRYRTLISEMRAEQIVIDDAEAAWFYKQKLQLSEVQKQLLETSLGTQTESYADCERESVRLFKRIHQSSLPQGGVRKPFGQSRFGKPFRKPGSSVAPSTASASSTSSWRSSGSKMPLGASAVNVAEQEEEMQEDPDGHEVAEVNQDEEIESDSEALAGLKEEIDVLAAEMDAAAEEGCDAADLDAIEEQLDGAVEALVTLKEARTQIAAMRKDRGYKGPQSQSSSSAPRKGSGKKGSNDGCFACGALGHYKGDPACPKTRKPGGKFGGKSASSSYRPGSTPKSSTNEAKVSEANVVDFLEPAHVRFGMDEVVHIHETMVIESLAEALTMHAGRGSTGLSGDKVHQAALDSACNRSCAGVEWIRLYEDALRFAPEWMRSLVVRVPEQERFRFGNGGVLVSQERIRLPVLLGRKILLVWVSNVPCQSLGCLLGKDFMDAMGALHDYAGNRVQFQYLAPGHWMRLGRLLAGHSSVSCLPTPLAAWPPLLSLPWIPVGRGRVCEVQVASKSKWLLKKIEKIWFPHDVDGSEELHSHVLAAEHLELSSSKAVPVSGYARTPRNSNHRRNSQNENFSAMASDVLPLDGSLGLALARHSSMAHSEASHPLCSSPSSSSQHSGRLEGSDRRHGSSRNLAEALVVSSSDRGQVQCLRSERLCTSSRSPGTSCGISGGPECLVCSHGTEEEAQEGYPAGRDQGDSSPTRAHLCGSDETTSSPTWSQRRLAQAQRRIASYSRSPASRGSARRHGGQDPAEVGSDGASSNRTASMVADDIIDGSSESSGEEQDSPQECSSPTGQSNQCSGDRCHDGGGQPTSSRSSRSSGARARVLPAGRTSPSPTRLGRVRHKLAPGGGRRDGGGAVQENSGGGSSQVCPSGDGSNGKDRKRKHSVRDSIGVIEPTHFMKLKNGLRQVVHQGFQRLRKLHQALTVSFEDVQDSLEANEYDLKLAIAEGDKDPFLGALQLPSVTEFADVSAHRVLASENLPKDAALKVGETFTDVEQVKKQAQKRGHATMKSMTLSTGYDFMKPAHQRAALEEIRQERPYAQVVAFPCGPWSPLHQLRSRDRHRVMLLRWRRRKHRRLVRFAVQIAREQLAGGRHFVLENPSCSLAWRKVPELQALMQEPGVFLCETDQCRYGLTGPHGGLHRKRTWLLTSSEEVAKTFQDSLCDGSHVHEHVIGGDAARRAGSLYSSLCTGDGSWL